MFRPIYIIGFSGCRPTHEAGRSAEEIDNMRGCMKEALERLSAQASEIDAEIELLASVAEGADILACETAQNMGIPLHIILPKPVELFKNDFKKSTPEVWHRAISIIEHARKSVDGSTFRIVDAPSESPSCYQATNYHILEACDLMMILWNGIPTGKAGGTGDCYLQAMALDMPVMVLNTLEKDDKIQPFNLDAFCCTKSDDSGMPVFNEVKSFFSHSNHDECFQAVRNSLEEAASKHSRWFRRALTISIVSHGLGALIAGIAVSYSGIISNRSLAILSASELLLVGTALILMLWHNHKHTHRQWIKARFAAELMRGYQATAGIIDPLYPNMRHHAPEWRRFALTATMSATRELPNSKMDLEALKAYYLDNRIRDQGLYFEKNATKASPWFNIFQNCSKWASWLAVISVTIALSYKASVWYDTVYSGAYTEDKSLTSETIKTFIIYFLPVALPLIAGISSSLMSSLDINRRRMRYSVMANFLRKQEKLINGVYSNETLRAAVVKTEELLLDEQIEWMASAESESLH